MTFEEKVQAHIAHARAHHIAKGTAAPLLWRMFWKLGWQLPPPLFLGFATLVLIYGSFFGTFWGLTMYLLDWHARGISVPMALGLAALAGLLFGSLLAAVLRRTARRLALPAWDSHPGPH